MYKNKYLHRDFYLEGGSRFQTENVYLEKDKKEIQVLAFQSDTRKKGKLLREPVCIQLTSLLMEQI